MKKIFILLLLISVSAVSVWYYRSTHPQCIPIYGSWFRPGDYQSVKKIAAAIGNIQENSPEDYRRICTLATYLQLIDFENSSLAVPENTGGSYQWINENPRVKGSILISRRITRESLSVVEAILVHEGCHANQYAEGHEPDELECRERAQKYLPKKPAMPLPELSASLIQQTGYENF